MTTFFVALACILAAAPDAGVDSPASTEPAPAAPTVSTSHPYRLDFAMGQEHSPTKSAEWFDTLGQPVSRLRLTSDFSAWQEGLELALGLSYAGHGGNHQLMTVALVALDAGAIYTWPALGLWNFLYPYGHAAVMVGYLPVRAPGALGDNVFVPGVYGGVGVRLDPRVNRQRDRFRVFAFGEAGLASWYPAKIRMHRLNTDESDSLPAQATPLGRLNLLGWSWRAGVGVGF
jgi:hypothetical protein